MKISQSNLSFNWARLQSFKRAYIKAKAEGYETFFFARREWLIDYAKYTIEYLELRIRL